MSDSLMAIYVEPHQCPSHQSILLTQGRICKIFAKFFWELAILKNSVFLSQSFRIIFSKKKNLFLLHPHENQSQIMWQNGWDSILMFSLVSSKFLAMRNITLYSVSTYASNVDVDIMAKLVGCKVISSWQQK